MTEKQANHFRLVGAIAVGLALVAVLAWWLTQRSQAASPVAPTPRGGSAPQEVRLPDTTPVAPTTTTTSALAIPPPSERKLVEESPTVPNVAAAAAAGPVELHLLFVGPQGPNVRVVHGLVRLEGPDGLRRDHEVEDGSHTTIRGLERRRYDVLVRAPGFLERHETIDLAEPWPVGPERAEGVVTEDGNTDTTTKRTVQFYLWPVNWTAVIVRTRDGRPVRELAADLGLEPRRLFSGAFDVHAQLSLPGAEDPKDARPVATFHPPVKYQGTELEGGAIGALELSGPQSVWACLTLFGMPLGWELVHAGDREVVFDVDQTTYDACCARLKLRVLDAKTRTPIPEARVTLLADTSAHRRKDQNRVVPEGDGTVELKRIVPGKYELTVTRGDDIDQRRIDLAPKQYLDVGDVLLEQGTRIDVLVVDEAGQPASAYVEIGPFEPGQRVDALYPPMLRWSSDESGHFRLPMPTKRSIVRARVEIGTTRGQPAQGQRSANLLLDPAHAPTQPWKIVMHEPVSTTFQVSLRDVTTVEVSDELGIVDMWPRVDAQGHATCDLIPGPHHARYLDAAAKSRNEQDFTVAKDSATVRGP